MTQKRVEITILFNHNIHIIKVEVNPKGGKEMKIYTKFPYYFEVHVAGYNRADFSELPEPFFLNTIVSEDYITSIVTAEVQTLEESMNRFEEIQRWCHHQDSLIQNGCRVTLEQMVKVIGLGESSKEREVIRSQQWQAKESAHITFADVHADGVWDASLSEELVQKRNYLSLDYIARNGKQFRVLTLHFATVEMALEEANYLQNILQAGGFKGELTVENSIAVDVIGPPLTRPVIIGV